MQERKLISVIVTYYNNGPVIYETLSSIFTQTYPNIEVIVTDDHSKDYDYDSINEWVEKNRGENIKNVIIRTNEKNLGTVKNLEIAKSLASGEYITQIAGDDCFSDKYVFEKFIDYFETLGEEAEFLTGQCELYDVDLKKKLGDFVTEESVKIMTTYPPEKLFNELSVKCIVPAVYFSKKRLQNKIGNLSNNYRLIEDWTSSLRMARNGVKLYYCNESLMKHRDGGVSHGNNSKNNSVYRSYVHDYITAYKRDILPYCDKLDDENLLTVTKAYAYWYNEYRKLPTDDQIVCNTTAQVQQPKRKNIVKRGMMKLIDGLIDKMNMVRFSVQDKWFK